MFEDLDWGGALKRAALTVAFYLVLVYILNVAMPGSIGSPVVVATNAAFLFLLFTVFHAYVDRRKRRRQAQRRDQEKGKKPAGKGSPSPTGEDGEDQPSVLKGRHNPNTSRKKAARRRR